MTLALADELLLITHDFQTGKARLADPALGIGLSAALLAELVFCGALVIDGGRLTPGGHPPVDALTQALLDETLEHGRDVDPPVDEWLASRRRQVRDRVADRMVAAGELQRQQTRRFGRVVVRLHPTRPAEAYVRVQRLGAYLRTRCDMSAGDAVLAALVTAIAPGGDLLALDDNDRAQLAAIIPQLPLPLRDLLAITGTLVRAAERNPYL